MPRNFAEVPIETACDNCDNRAQWICMSLRSRQAIVLCGDCSVKFGWFVEEGLMDNE